MYTPVHALKPASDAPLSGNRNAYCSCLPARAALVGGPYQEETTTDIISSSQQTFSSSEDYQRVRTLLSTCSNATTNVAALPPTEPSATADLAGKRVHRVNVAVMVFPCLLDRRVSVTTDTTDSSSGSVSRSISASVSRSIPAHPRLPDR